MDRKITEGTGASGFPKGINTIKTKMLLIILCCWILPVTVIGVSSIVIYGTGYRERMDSSMEIELNFAAELTGERLETLAGLATDSDFSRVMEQYYTSFSVGNMPQRTLTRTVKNYTNAKYNPKLFSVSDVVFVNNTDCHYYQSTDSLAAWEDYQRNIYPLLRELADGLEGEMGLYIYGGELYMTRRLDLSGNSVGSMMAEKTAFGYLFLKVRKDYLLEYFLDSTIWEKNIKYTVTGNKYTCVDDDGFEIKEPDRLRSGLEIYSENKEKYVMAGRKNSESVNFFYTANVYKKKLYKSNDTIIYLIITVILIVVPVTYTIMRFFYKTINEPINKLVTATQKIREGELGGQIESTADDELGYLTNSFNHMSAELKRLFDYAYKEEIALRDAKLFSLQSQINPHFLNNTLELMNWKARLAGAEDISQMIEALSTMLDAAMNRSNRHQITVREEMEFADAYLYIVKMRFGKRITVKKEIDSSLLDTLVPRLTIQPLLENAVVHGIEPVRQGTIWLRIKREGNDAVIEVENDGAELGREDINRINAALGDFSDDAAADGTRRSLGIRNVDERIKLFCGYNYGLQIGINENGNTLNRLTIKIVDNEQK